MRILTIVPAAAFLALLPVAMVRAAEALPPLPEGDGLAAQYPGDAGIEDDPAVVFADGFETVEGEFLTTEYRENHPDDWNHKWDRAWHTVRVTREPGNVHSGRKAFEATHTQPQSYGVDKHFADGFDTLFVRYYMKVHPEFPGVHHTGMSLMAGAPGINQAEGTGVRPDGTNHFMVSIDTEARGRRSRITPPGRLNIYCYHMDQMRQWGDIFYPTGTIRPEDNPVLFGEEFVPRPNRIPERGRWYCYELMVKANTPGQRDGRVAFWVDGELAGDFPGIRFRTDPALKINQVVLNSYSSRRRPRPNVTLWYDDVVVATSYIGPQKAAEAAE